MMSRSSRKVHAKAISLLKGMLPMLDVADPNDRAFGLATICVCVVSVGYLAHNPCIVTRMVELRVIMLVFFSFNSLPPMVADMRPLFIKLRVSFKPFSNFVC